MRPGLPSTVLRQSVPDWLSPLPPPGLFAMKLQRLRPLSLPLQIHAGFPPLAISLSSLPFGCQGRHGLTIFVLHCGNCLGEYLAHGLSSPTLPLLPPEFRNHGRRPGGDQVFPFAFYERPSPARKPFEMDIKLFLLFELSNVFEYACPSSTHARLCSSSLRALRT